MIENHPTPTAETDIGYGQILAILIRRGIWFLGAFSGALAAAAFFTLTEEPTYQSSMQLLVEPNYQEELRQSQTGSNPAQERPGKMDYATQLNLMRSNQFFEQAADALSTEYPELTADQLQRSLTLFQLEEGDTETRIFQATYTDHDPIKTQKVLDTLKQIYLSYNLEQQELRLTRGLSFINNQLDTARQSLRQSQNALEQFRQGQSVIDPSQQATAITDALNRVRQEQQTIQAQYQEAQARFQILQEQLSLSPQNALNASRLSQSTRLQNLLNALQQTELELAERRVVFSDADPSVQNLMDQRDNQLALVRQEVGQILGLPSVAAAGGEDVLTVGQLGDVELQLVSEMAAVQANLEGLQARNQSLAQAEQQLRAELNRFPGLMAEYDRLQPDVEIERNVLQQLLEERERLSAELARGGYNWQVVEAPQLGDKISPNPVQNMMLGTIAGVFLGAIAAFVRESMDGVIHSTGEIEKRTALPLLGQIPKLASLKTHRWRLPFWGHQAYSREPAVIQALYQSPPRESLDLLYKNIQLLNPQAQPRSLMVTSALPGEGKTTLALGLALSAARLHQRVLLIDANLRQPALHQKLDLPNDQGLSLLLEQGMTATEPIQLSLLNTQIDVLTAGTESADPVRLLSSPYMEKLMDAATSGYDLVLLDAPPMMGMVDALQLASFCNGIILVAQVDRITQTDLNQAIAMLSRLNVLGVVANHAKKATIRPVKPKG